MRISRVTLPSIRVTDETFRYRKSDDTNLAETFARVRERLRLEALAGPEMPAQAVARPVRRVRAGHLSLPLFPMESAAPC